MSGKTDLVRQCLFCKLNQDFITEVIGLSVTNDYGCELSDAVVVHNCASIDEELMSAWGVFPNP